MFLVISLAPIF